MELARRALPSYPAETDTFLARVGIAIKSLCILCWTSIRNQLHCVLSSGSTEVKGFVTLLHYQDCYRVLRSSLTIVFFKSKHVIIIIFHLFALEQLLNSVKILRFICTDINSLNYIVCWLLDRTIIFVILNNTFKINNLPNVINFSSL